MTISLFKDIGMDSKEIKPVFETYGGSDKVSFDMNAREFATAAQNIVNRAREKAFSKGLPIYYKRNNNIIAEFADGRTETVLE